MAKYLGKPLKIKENSSIKGKSFGGLPPPEPPRTVKGPPLRGGGRCYLRRNAAADNCIQTSFIYKYKIHAYKMGLKTNIKDF